MRRTCCSSRSRRTRRPSSSTCSAGGVERASAAGSWRPPAATRSSSRRWSRWRPRAARESPYRRRSRPCSLPVSTSSGPGSATCWSAVRSRARSFTAPPSRHSRMAASVDGELVALLRKDLVRPEQPLLPGRRRLPLPPPAHPRHRLRGVAQGDPRRAARALRRLARRQRKRAGRARRDPRLSPGAGLPLPRGARPPRRPRHGLGRTGGDASPRRRRPCPRARRRACGDPLALARVGALAGGRPESARRAARVGARRRASRAISIEPLRYSMRPSRPHERQATSGCSLAPGSPGSISSFSPLPNGG